jgi:NarL family two-component system response regulator LiaR
MTDTIRIIVVDDHPVVRKGIVAMLETEPGLEIIAECSGGKEAIQKVVALKPDVTLMDLVMPEVDGVEAIQQITCIDPSARILVLTSFSSEDKVIASINAGATGYLLKDSDPEVLIQAIRQVHQGESSLHPAAAKHLVARLSRPQSANTSKLESLTDRELEVLKYVAQGLSNQEIAQVMVISQATVHSHVNKILNKLEVNSRTQAALLALREGLVPLSGGPGDNLA